MILVHQRSGVVNSPNMLCGPGGAVDAQDRHKPDTYTLNKELSEESLKTRIYPNLTWHLFYTKTTNAGKIASSYWTDWNDRNNKSLSILGPDPSHMFEVDMNYNWRTLNGVYNEIIPGSGHAWLLLDDILRFNNTNTVFMPTFVTLCRTLRPMVS